MGSEVEEENNKTSDDESASQKNMTKTDQITKNINTFNIGLQTANQNLVQINNSLKKYNLMQQAIQDYHIAINVEETRLHLLIKHIHSTLQFSKCIKENQAEINQLIAKNPELSEKYSHSLRDSNIDPTLYEIPIFSFIEPKFNSTILHKYDANMQKYILENVDELRANRLSSLKLIRRELEQHYNQELHKQFIQTLQNTNVVYLLKDIFPEKYL